MSKTLIEYVKSVFGKIASHANTEPCTLHRIEPDGDVANQTEIFGSLSFGCYKLVTKSVKVGIFNFGECRLVVVANVGNSLSDYSYTSFSQDGFEYLDVGVGVFLSAVVDMDLGIREEYSAEQVDNELMFQHEESTYKGHTLADLMEYFEPIHCFKIEKDSVYYDSDFERLAYIVYSHLDELIPIDNRQLRESYRRALVSQGCLYGDNLYLSIGAMYWKHSFLEIYRCVEGMFSLPYAKKLKGTIGFNGDTRQLAKVCHQELKWKRNEINSLRMLVELMQEQDIRATNIFETSLFNHLRDEAGVLNDKYKEKIADKIYQLRNQLVHQFYLEDEVTVEEHDWEIMIGFIIQLYISTLIEYAEAPRLAG